MHSDFIVPKIQPDELLTGYRGRIGGWNGCESSRMIGEGMLMQYPLAARWACHTSQFMEAAAQANGMTFLELIRDHTIYILRADSSRHTQLAFERPRALSAQAITAMYSSTGRIWGCEVCMHTDLQRLGFSYWRRSHQVPGRVLCSLHSSPLISIRETLLLPGGPAHSEPFIDSTRRQAAASDMQSPGSEFAVAILDTMIGTFHRPAQQTAAEAIREGLRSQGIDPNDCAKRKGLQAALTKHFTPAWLEAVAGKRSSRPASIGKKIERVLDARASSRAVDLAIVARLGFTDISEALVSFGLQPRNQNRLPECERLADQIRCGPNVIVDTAIACQHAELNHGRHTDCGEMTSCIIPDRLQDKSKSLARTQGIAG